MSQDASTGRELIRAAIDRAVAGAGPVMRQNFVHDHWVMSPQEFEAYWRTNPVAGFCTVSPRGRPHVVPIEPKLVDGALVMSTFAGAVRVRDLRSNPNASLISWASAYEAVIVYGTAVIDNDESGAMVTVRLVPDRIYSIRPPSWHAAAKKT